MNTVYFNSDSVARVHDEDLSAIPLAFIATKESSLKIFETLVRSVASQMAIPMTQRQRGKICQKRHSRPSVDAW